MSVLVIADADDPDVLRLQDRAAGGFAWFKLGLPNAAYEVNTRDGVVQVVAEGTTLSPTAAPDRVLYRRWKVSPPFPLVGDSSVRDSARRDLIHSIVMREFEAVLEDVIWLLYSRAATAFSRSPLRYPGRLALMSQLHGVVPVPAWYVSTRPPAMEGRVVTKVLSSDQSFDADSRLSTVELDLTSAPERFPCPTFVQQRIRSSRELRVAHCFGVTAAVVQQCSTGERPVDLRFASEVHRSPFAVEGDLAAEVASVAQELSLRVFTADVLLDEDGRRHWIDVNPDGLFVAADTAEGHLIGALVEGLSARSSRAATTPT